jgi:hypothetical protein
LLKNLCFILLHIGIVYNAVGHTLVIVKDINDINYVSLTKIAKYNLHPAEYGTVVIKSFGTPRYDEPAHEFPPSINKIIFMGHGGPGHFEGIDAAAFTAETTRLMGVLNAADVLTVDNLRLLSCGSATRPAGEDSRSTTDAIIDGLVTANIPGLVVTIQGNAGTSITDVFTEGIDDTIRIVIEDRAGEVFVIQEELKDHQPCLELIGDCPEIIRDIFDTIPADFKENFRRYAHYLQKRHTELALTPTQRAYLAYYNQGVRTFYHELIARSDDGDHLLPDGADLFNTVFNSNHYSGLAPAARGGYLTLVKNGIPPAIAVAPPLPAVDAPLDGAHLADAIPPGEAL